MHTFKSSVNATFNLFATKCFNVLYPQIPSLSCKQIGVCMIKKHGFCKNPAKVGMKKVAAAMICFENFRHSPDM